MRIISFIFLAFGFLSLQSQDIVQITNPDIIKQEIIKHSAETKNLKSNFVQEKHLSMLEEVVESTGRFAFRRENDILWSYKTPYEYSILVANGKFTIDNEGEIKEFDLNSNPMFGQISNMIIMAVSGNFADNEMFETTFFKSDNFTIAKLKSKDAIISEMLSSIEIYFNNNLDVVKVKFNEAGDDFTLIKFADLERNIKIEDDEFILSK